MLKNSLLQNNMKKQSSQNREAIEAGKEQEQQLQQFSSKIMEKPIVSQYFQQYSHHMDFFARLVSKEISKLTLNMMQQKIWYKNRQNYDNQREEFQRKMTIRTKVSTINKEVVILSIQWGQFEIDVQVLNIRGVNKHHGVSTSSGAYGNIYEGMFSKNKIAIKCIPIKSKSTRFNAIKQWFLLKIASVAQFGPKLLSCFGFDILMYQNCCQFAMEVCQMPVSSVNYQHMFYNLSMMHRLHMVHLDIKPENVMMSHSFKKPVFIDFGLSKLIFQNIGEKSLTSFIGTITFCSKQMARCYSNKNKEYIDLYMNDLHALKETFLYFSQFHQTQCNEDVITMLDLYKQNDFTYLIGVLMKFYLFKNKFDLFFQLLNSNYSSKDRNYIKIQGLIFLFQLLPSNHLKSVFLKITKELQIASQLYSKIKIFLQLGTQKICSSYSLREEEKYEYFSQISLQLLHEGQNLEIEEVNNEREIFFLLSSEQNIKKLSFKKYVEVYLKFMSYTNNKYQANAFKREKVASLYYSLFISREIPSLLKGRKIVKQTIQHILQWGLHSQQLAENKDYFPLFLFKIYDFLVILHSQTSQQFLALVTLIFNHSSLIKIYKQLFLLRVKQSSLLTKKRIFLKNCQSRLKFFDKIKEWIADKEKQLQFECLDAHKQIKQEDHYFKVSSQFLDQFGTQLLQYEKILKAQAYSKEDSDLLIEAFNAMSHRFKDHRFFYFSIHLYFLFNFQGKNRVVSRKIYNIFKNNIRDEEIESQFSFYFQLQKIYKVIDSYTDNISKEVLDEIVSVLDNVHFQDLIFLKQQIDLIFNKLMVQKRELNVLKQQKVFYSNNFLEKILSSYLYCFQEQLIPNCMEHNMPETLEIYCLLVFSQTLTPTREQKVIDVFSSEKFVNILKCQKCKQVIDINFQLFQLLKIFDEYWKPNLQQVSKESILSLFFQKQRKIETYIQKIDTEQGFILMEIALSMGQLICSTHPSLQQKYHGLEKYFEFSIQNNKIQYYFKKDQGNSFPIYYTLMFLYQHNYGKFIDFLIGLIFVLEQKMIIKNNKTILLYCSSVFYQLSQDQMLQLFKDLKDRHSNMNEKMPCIAILYTILFNTSHSKEIQKKILSEIMKLFHKLHSQIQRQLSVFFVVKIIEHIVPKINQHKRQWLYCNNKVAKMLMIEDRSFPMRKKEYWNACIKKRCLKDKMSNIYCFSQSNLKVKFRRK